MATWSLEKQGAPATRVNLTVKSGDIVEDTPLPAGVFELRSGARIVWQSPAQKDTFTFPPMVFTSTLSKDRLKNLVKSGAIMTLVTSYGRTCPVRCVAFSARLLDTPDSATKPQWRVDISLVEV